MTGLQKHAIKIVWGLFEHSKESDYALLDPALPRDFKREVSRIAEKFSVPIVILPTEGVISIDPTRYGRRFVRPIFIGKAVVRI